MAKQPNQPQPPRQPGPFLSKLAQQIKENAQKNQAQLATAPEPEFLIAKPDGQFLGDVVIKWIWKNDWVSVYAYYARGGSNIFEKEPGEYWVDFQFEDEFSTVLNTDQVKLFAEMLLSAYRWADVWEQHMGEYFKAKPTAPTLEVVDNDDSDNDSDNDDIGEEMGG